ncbi:MAG: hypothetical protein WCT40_03285 [Candidatus Magasanikbacteria bacterium]
MSKKFRIILAVCLSSLFVFFLLSGIFWYRQLRVNSANLRAHDQAIEDIINARRIDTNNSVAVDPFGDDQIVRVLFIGLDARVGQTSGHCDSIQLISVDDIAGTVDITAVPRGTYSPLPPGKGATSSDYYVSNACGLGGLEYGIKQIEKILGVKADYLVVVGFSEALGIIRSLGLPTTETLQWLRNRHGYAIGEPQRARNHSTFIKQMMIKFVPAKISTLNTALQYIVYKLVKTDLSFAQAQKIVEAVSAMDIVSHPEKIRLMMKPLFIVQDIPYDPEHIDEYLDQTLGPVKQWLAKDDYSGVSGATVQEKLLSVIQNSQDIPEFITWACQNNLWLQIEDDNKRLLAQYDLIVKYLALLPNQKDRESVIADYIIEMENRGELDWRAQAQKLLEKEAGIVID